MEHHEIIAEMLRNRKNNVENKKELKYTPKKSIKKQLEVPKEIEKVKLKENSIIEDFKNDDVVSDDRTNEEIERERRMLARFEKEPKRLDERCPFCGSYLIDKGSGIKQCEKITCYYSEHPKPYFKPRIIDPTIL